MLSLFFNNPGFAVVEGTGGITPSTPKIWLVPFPHCFAPKMSDFVIFMQSLTILPKFSPPPSQVDPIWETLSGGLQHTTLLEKKDSNNGVFLLTLHNFLRKTFFTEHLGTTTSGLN